jgi:phosphopantetheinyl transferase (holo-ACP synthase)
MAVIPDRIYTRLNWTGQRVAGGGSPPGGGQGVGASACGGEIEVVGDESNAPGLTLHGEALKKANELGLSTWSVSISHSQSHSVALVVAIGY